MKASMDQKINDLADYHHKLLDRTNSMQAFFNRNIFRMYQKAQARRWITENESEKNKWEPLSSAYAKSKRTRWAAAPGAGTKLMIASGKLVKAATGQEGFVKIATNTGLSVSLQSDFIGGAKYATIKRPVMNFSRKTINEMRDAIRAYMTWGA